MGPALGGPQGAHPSLWGSTGQGLRALAGEPSTGRERKGWWLVARAGPQGSPMPRRESGHYTGALHSHQRASGSTHHDYIQALKTLLVSAEESREDLLRAKGQRTGVREPVRIGKGPRERRKASSRPQHGWGRIGSHLPQAEARLPHPASIRCCPHSRTSPSASEPLTAGQAQLRTPWGRQQEHRSPAGKSLPSREGPALNTIGKTVCESVSKC